MFHKFPELHNKFEKYLRGNYASMPCMSVSINEFKKTFSFLKLNKSAEYDYISFDVVSNYFGKIYDPLQYIFNTSQEKGCIS